ncbi:MAG: hypothetical protein GY948_06910 [Alphaproteobacteria bacterium]|nr:hypothetical protein [Alphaproteobacteria bacterium]
MSESEQLEQGSIDLLGIDRRQFIAHALALAAMPIVAHAAPEIPESTQAAIEALTGGARVSAGRVILTMPKLAENGRSVPLTLEVESPMTMTDYVRSVHVFAGKNPIPTVARFHFGPYSGAAYVKTRVRLADTQQVVALAEMSDGSVWTGQTRGVVTLGGCLDPVL